MFFITQLIVLFNNLSSRCCNNHFTNNKLLVVIEFQIETQKLNWTAASRVGSLQNATHVPGGGTVKVVRKTEITTVPLFKNIFGSIFCPTPKNYCIPIVACCPPSKKVNCHV